MLNNKIAYAAVIAVAIMSSACTSNPLSPGIEYMPDMYRGPALETYGVSIVNGVDVPTARIPVSKTIARGNEPYAFLDTPEDYEAAGNALINPIIDIKMAETKGKEIYTKYCIHCHGEKGDGQGSIKVKGEAFPVPSYYDDAHKNLPDGKMFHTLHFGKGLMGSHASQLTKNERWILVAYVNKLQNDALGNLNTTTPADSTKK